MLILTGNGDVLEPEGGIAAIGSGGNYALSAAKALADYEQDPEVLARRAMQIAAEVCVFTNDRLTVETIEALTPIARLGSPRSAARPPNLRRRVRRAAVRLRDGRRRRALSPAARRCAPVDVDASRVIRTIAGLQALPPPGLRRPRRALGEKRLVHNYGHGGGGHHA